MALRVKPYLTQIVTTILWQLNNKSAKVRQPFVFEYIGPQSAYYCNPVVIILEDALIDCDLGWSHSAWLLCGLIMCFPAIRNEYRGA